METIPLQALFLCGLTPRSTRTQPALAAWFGSFFNDDSASPRKALGPPISRNASQVGTLCKGVTFQTRPLGRWISCLQEGSAPRLGEAGIKGQQLGTSAIAGHQGNEVVGESGLARGKLQGFSNQRRGLHFDPFHVEQAPLGLMNAGGVPSRRPFQHPAQFHEYEDGQEDATLV